MWQFGESNPVGWRLFLDKPWGILFFPRPAIQTLP